MMYWQKEIETMDRKDLAIKITAAFVHYAI